MARQIPTSEIETIVDAVRNRPSGASLSEIDGVCPGLPRRTLQARIKRLVDAGRLVRKGERRGARYFLPEEASDGATRPVAADTVRTPHETGLFPPLSKVGEEILQLVSRPLFAREPVGYDSAFLDEYSPDRTFYLSEAERRRLRERGRGETPPAPAGTHARDILDRLLIDLSWNSIHSMTPMSPVCLASTNSNAWNSFFATSLPGLMNVPPQVRGATSIHGRTRSFPFALASRIEGYDR